MRTKSILILKWIIWNGTVFMLNWIVWNGTVFDIETVLMLNWILQNRTVLTFNCVQTKSILILNWIDWIRTIRLNWIKNEIEMFLTIKLCTHAKLNCLK